MIKQKFRRHVHFHTSLHQALTKWQRLKIIIFMLLSCISAFWVEKKNCLTLLNWNFWANVWVRLSWSISFNENHVSFKGDAKHQCRILNNTGIKLSVRIAWIEFPISLAFLNENHHAFIAWCRNTCAVHLFLLLEGIKIYG